MKKRVTMRDIALKLNVSVVTVSKALANKEGVGKDLAIKIKEIADELGYQYAAAEKNGAEQSCTIGVLVPHRFMGKYNSFYWDMYQGVVQGLSKKNGYAILEVVLPEDEKNCVSPGLLQNERVDGIIILGQMKSNYIDSIIRYGMPVVFLDFYDKHSDVDAVISDNINGSYNITSYLCENGHRNIGFVGSINRTSSILDRYLGYMKALLENNLPVNQEWLIPDRDEEGNIFSHFVLPQNMPTAFVCNCDETAYRFSQHLKEAGYEIPNHVSIVSFDNYLYATIAKPELTTMEVNVTKMAENAANSIMNKIMDPTFRSGRQMVEGRIIKRSSVKRLK